MAKKRRKKKPSKPRSPGETPSIPDEEADPPNLQRASGQGGSRRDAARQPSYACAGVESWTPHEDREPALASRASG